MNERTSYKLTQEEFIKRGNEIHGNKYDYSKVNYVNQRTKVEIICPIHGSFFQLPKNHMKGQGCPLCGKKYAATWRKGQYDIFSEKFYKIYSGKYELPYIKDEYENNKSRITVRKISDDSEKQYYAEYLLGDEFSKGNEERKTYNYEEISKLAKGNKLKPFDGTVTYLIDRLIATCPIHGEYNTTLKSVLNNKYGCTRCIGSKIMSNRKITEETATEKIKAKYGDEIIPIGNFIDMSTPMEFQCNKGHKFMRTPNNLLSRAYKISCPICSKEQLNIDRTKTKEDFIADALKIYDKDDYDFSNTKYISSKDKIEIKCNKCGRTFSVEANSFLQGHGCPYHNCNSSLMEKEVVQFIKDLNISIITNDRIILKGNELDIYIPSKKLAIEFDGLYWHNELYKDENYHLRKTEACNKQGIRLIHIFEDEWTNKKEIWKSIIKHIIGNSNERIYGRKCEIRDVSPTESTNFLNANHLQGACPSQIKIGLYYNNELVSLMTFGKTRHFIGNSSHEYELLRFCNKLNTTVIGSASKLFKHFLKAYNPNNIVSYADRRWSMGGIYEILGFTLYNKSKPNYFYVIGDRRKYRFNFRKSILVKKYNCPIEMSERDFCKQQKWYRIYDCGCLCYEWKK